MPASLPSIWSATITAYRDVGRVLGAMPGLAVTAGALLIGTSILDSLLVRAVVPASSLLGREVTGLITGFLLTPFLIAVHRFIILDEVTPRYALELRDPRFQIFFGWTVVLNVGLSLLIAAVRLVGALPMWAGTIAVLLGLALVAAAVTFLIFSLRATILFPAIAVDAVGATWRNAMHDSRHYAGHMFVLLGVASLPFTLAAIVILRMKTAIDSLAGSLFALALADLAVVAYTAMVVALVSRLYVTLGDRLNQAPEPDGPAS
jgi:hypothetical protein